MKYPGFHLRIAPLLVLLTACATQSDTAREGEQPAAPPAPAATDQTTQGVAPASSSLTRAPIVVQGSGRFVGAPQPVEEPAGSSNDGYELNFVDTEIASVVASVIGEGLQLPYAVDPQVKGTMTLQSSRPLARSEVLPALESALELHALALVDIGGTFQVMPAKDAARRAGELRTVASRQPGFGIQIVPLRYISVTDMEKVLRPLAGEGGILRVDEARNLLVVAGTSRELRKLLDVIQTFDVNWLEGMSFGLYPVEYVEASIIVDELRKVFVDAGSPIANVVRLVPLSRLNSVMVVTHEPSYLVQVEAWIKRLDIGVATPGRRIYVYDVQNGKADDLADSLNNILSLSDAGSAGAGPRAAPFESLSRAGSDSMFGGARPARRGLSSPATQAMPEVTNAPAISSTQGEPGALKIVPNVENNALLIYADPSEFVLIENALKRLDVRPLQVLIEASLAEVTLTDDLKYGVQWSYQSSSGPVVLSDASNGSVNQQFPGFSYLFTGREGIRAVLNAIATLTDVNVISSPKLLVLNNREAELQIGDQVPITVQSSVSTVGEAAPIVNSVQLRDTGVILRITPRANKSGLVLLDIAQEVSDVVPTTTSNIDSPTIQQRRLSSSVAVHDGETIALGGLIRDTKSRARGGIPYLREIPLVGELFGSTSKNARRTELIVLITPRVVRSSSESDEMMDELREQFKGLRKNLPQWQPHAPSTPPASPATGAPGTTAPATSSSGETKNEAPPPPAP